MLYGNKQFHCIHKKGDIDKDIAEDVETRFDTSNHRLDRPVLKGKNKQIIRLIKYGLGRKNMTKFVRLKAKKYSY